MDLEFKKSLLSLQFENLRIFLRLRPYKYKVQKAVGERISNELDEVNKKLKDCQKIRLEHFEPLFKLILCEDIDNNTKITALKCLYVLLLLGIIDADSDFVIISSMMDTVNNPSKIPKAINTDEMIFFEILEIFKLLISKNMCESLSDVQVCECLQTCFRIYFEPKSSDILCCAAENVLNSFLIFLFNNDTIFNALQSENLSPLTPLSLPSKKAPSKISNNFGKLKIVNEFEVLCGEKNIESVDISSPSRFGLSTLHEFLRFLISLSDPNIKNNKKEYLEFSLSQITLVLEIGANKIISSSTLVGLLRERLCKNINELFSHHSVTIFSKSLNLFKLLLKRHRSILKNEIEIMLTCLLDLFYKVTDLTSDKKGLIGEFIATLLNDHFLLIDLFVNYDLQINYSNICEYYFIVVNHILLTEFNTNILASIMHLFDALDRSVQDNEIENTFRLLLMNKKNYLFGVDILNKSLSKGIKYFVEKNLINSNYEMDLAQIFRYDINVDKKSLGEYIGKKGCAKLLRCYCECFDIKGVRIDEALRKFLESFRIPGESAVIENILTVFTEQYSQLNPDVFHDNDSIFTLCYAIIMLNVDQYNKVVKQQKSMTLDEFVNNLRGVNGGEDFPLDLLTKIYHSIQSQEMVVPLEQTGHVKSNYIWSLASERSSKIPYHYYSLKNFVLPKAFFRIISTPLVSVLCKLIIRISDPAILDITLSGFHIVTKLAVKYNFTQTLDRLIITLLKFSHLLRSAADNNPLEIEYIIFDLANNLLSQKCLVEAFKIINNFSYHLILSWRYIFACISNLCACELLPTRMYEFEDFVHQSGVYFLVVGKRLTKKSVEPTSFLDTFIQMININSDQSDAGVSEEVFQNAQNIVAQCQLEQLIGNFDKLSNESFLELGKSLIQFSNLSPTKIPYDLDNAESPFVSFLTSPCVSTFFLESLFLLLLVNESKIHYLLPEILSLLIDSTVKTTHLTILSDRAIQGTIRLAMRIHDLKYVDSFLLCLRSFLLNPKLLIESSASIVCGLHELLRIRSTVIRSFWDWICILEILEISGCSRNSLLTSVSICPEMVQNSSTTLNIPKSNPDNPLSEIYQQKAIYDAIDDGGGKDDLFGVKPTFTDFKIQALIKTVHCLSFLILSQPSCLLHNNILPILHALVTCAESIFYVSRMFSNTHINSLNVSVSERDLESHTQCILNMIYNMFSSSSNVLIEYIRALDHEALSDDECSVFLWYSCWSHLLRRMAVFIIDSRRTIRLMCMCHMERVLRITNIQYMTVNEWYACFDRILLPMLQLLSRRPPSQDSSELDETKSRALGLVMRIFLQKLPTLHRHAQFTKLWQMMLETFVNYKKSKSTDILQEAIPEYLKNMLSVMATSSGVFSQSNTLLFKITYTYLKDNFPELVQILPTPEGNSESSYLSQFPANEPVESLNNQLSNDSLVDKKQILPVHLPNFKIVTSFVANANDAKQILD